MQSNDQRQPPTDPLDYLNLTSPPPKPVKISIKTLIIGVVVGVVGLIAVLYVFNSLQAQKNAAASPLPFVAKLQKLSTITTDYHSKIRSSALQDVNSSFRMVIQTVNNDIAEPLVTYGIDLNKNAKQISSIEAKSTAELTERLDDAYLNTTFDDTYTREMIYEIEEAQFIMNRLLRTTSSVKMKTLIDSTMKDFNSLKKRFAEAQRS